MPVAAIAWVGHSGSFILRRNALKRGSSAMLLNRGSPTISTSATSFCLYARSSHSSREIVIAAIRVGQGDTERTRVGPLRNLRFQRLVRLGLTAGRLQDDREEHSVDSPRRLPAAPWQAPPPALPCASSVLPRYLRVHTKPGSTSSNFRYMPSASANRPAR